MIGVVCCSSVGPSERGGAPRCPVKKPKYVLHTYCGKVCLKHHHRCWDNMGEMLHWWQPRVNIDNPEELEEYKNYCLQLHECLTQ